MVGAIVVVALWTVAGGAALWALIYELRVHPRLWQARSVTR